jgi:CcmD family protein
VRTALVTLLLLWVPGALTAQAAELGQQTFGRAYWHVFIGYALVWLFVGGWVISIARRLARVEKRLEGE